MNLIITPDPKRELYELTEDFHVSVFGEDIWVPSGFRYDGASIPPAAWQVIHTPFNPMVMVPAVAHDWIYYNHQVGKDKADEILQVLLEENGVSSTKSWIIFQAVQVAGGPYWENDDDDKIFLKALYEKHKDDDDVDKFNFPDFVMEDDN